MILAASIILEVRRICYANNSVSDFTEYLIFNFRFVLIFSDLVEKVYFKESKQELLAE